MNPAEPNEPANQPGPIPPDAPAQGGGYGSSSFASPAAPQIIQPTVSPPPSADVAPAMTDITPPPPPAPTAEAVPQPQAWEQPPATAAAPTEPNPVAPPQPEQPWTTAQPAAFMQQPGQAPPQPQQPDYGAAPVVNGGMPPMPTAGATPAPHKSRKPLLIGGIVLAALIVICGASFAYTQLMAPNPTKTFNAALKNALSTKSVTQTSSDSGVNLTLKYDVSDVKNPKISSALTSSQDSLSLNEEGYGTLKDLYFKDKASTGASQLGLSAVTDKWIQFKKNGVTPSDDTAALSTLFSQLYDPNYMLLGEYVYGNFSDSDRASLTSYITTNNLYSYDVSKVKKDKLDSQDVYVYSLSIDASKLKAYNEKVAAVYGISKATADDAVSQEVDSVGSKTIKATAYVSIKDSELIEVKVDTATTKYDNFNATTLPAQPKADLQWSDYLKALGVDPTTMDSSQSSSTDSDADTIRKTDINALDSHIEAYYAENGYYPLLSDINNASWRSQNLDGIDSTEFKDPAGSTDQLAAAPKVHQYSYQVGEDNTLGACDNQATDCLYFALTATLDDGTTYTKTSF